jgi:hypothetical protein
MMLRRLRDTGALAAAAAAASALCLTAGMPAATASTVVQNALTATAPIVSGYRTGTCIQPGASPAVNDTPAALEPCDHAADQDWAIGPDGTIRSASGLCLDIYRDEKTSKAPVNLYACTGGANQQWHATAGTLVNPVSGKCLDDPRFATAPGIRLEIYKCNGGANQQWKLPAAPSQPNPRPARARA